MAAAHVPVPLLEDQDVQPHQEEPTPRHDPAEAGVALEISHLLPRQVLQHDPVEVVAVREPLHPPPEAILRAAATRQARLAVGAVRGIFRLPPTRGTTRLPAGQLLRQALVEVEVGPETPQFPLPVGPTLLAPWAAEEAPEATLPGLPTERQNEMCVMASGPPTTTVEGLSFPVAMEETLDEIFLLIIPAIGRSWNNHCSFVRVMTTTTKKIPIAVTVVLVFAVSPV